jgi:hypothetical protein
MDENHGARGSLRLVRLGVIVDHDVASLRAMTNPARNPEIAAPHKPNLNHERQVWAPGRTDALQSRRESGWPRPHATTGVREPDMRGGAG